MSTWDSIIIQLIFLDHNNWRMIIFRKRRINIIILEIMVVQSAFGWVDN